MLEARYSQTNHSNAALLGSISAQMVCSLMLLMSGGGGGGVWNY
jgi:hypothetical protein